MESVEDFLKTVHISFVVHEHPPVYTCEELEKFAIPGLASKNLLLRDQKGRRYFLVILPASKRTDLKKLSEIVGERKLSFASAEALKAKLGVDSGAVSPFGLLNDTSQDVEVYMDDEVYNAPVVHFHPNRNTASLELTTEMFHRYLKTIKNKIREVKL